MKQIAATLILLSACALGCSSSEPDDSATDAASSSSSSGGDGASGTTNDSGSAGSTTSATSSGTTGTTAGSNGSTGSGGTDGSDGAASTGGAPSTSSDGSAGEATTDVDAASGGTTGGVEPYANVVAVEVSGSDGSYTFNVSIESSDVGCTQYTDWWEVLSQDGELLYRRILTHSHTNDNGTTDDPTTPDNTFTRSGGPVEVSADEVVIVRAHNNIVGYNGMAMVGSPSAGFSDAPDIGSDFAADVEDDDPQVDSCAF